MKLVNAFRKINYGEKPGRFSAFFLNAPESKKEEVLKKAAHKANEEQRETFRRSGLKLDTE